MASKNNGEKYTVAAKDKFSSEFNLFVHLILTLTSFIDNINIDTSKGCLCNVHLSQSVARCWRRQMLACMRDDSVCRAAWA